MAREFAIINSLNAGELSPYVLARGDLAKYRNAAESLQNFIPLLGGGIQKRPGTRFIALAQDQSGPSRLVAFEASLSKCFILEFGNQTLRFFLDGALVMSGSVPYVVTTPYDTSTDDLWDLKFAHQSDVMYIVHPNHPPMKLEHLGDANWILVQPVFNPPASFAFNIDYASGSTLTLSATTGTGVTVTASNPGTFLAGDLSRFITNGIGNGVGSAIITAYSSDTVVTVDIVEPFTSATVIPGWTLHDAPGTWIAMGFIDGSGDWVDSGNLGDGQTTDLYSFNQEPTDITGRAANTPAAPGQLNCFRPSDVGRYIIAFGTQLLITNYISASHITVRNMGAIKDTRANLRGNNGVAPQAPGVWSLESQSWTADNGYPRATCFFQDRLMMSGTLQQPQTTWGSVTDDYENFAKGSGDSDALDFTINSGRLEAIQGIEEFRGNLFLGTLRTEYMVGGGNIQFGGAASAVTPSNVTPIRQSRFGSDRIQPIVVDEDLLYVKRSKTASGQMSFDIQQSNYSTKNITALNEIISGSGFKEMVWQQFPFRVIWFTTLDGNLVGLTFERQNDIWAWHRHFTGMDRPAPYDQFVSVASIVDPSLIIDQLWFCTARVIEGNTVYMIELSDPSLFEDCATSATFSPPARALPGLGYLNGRNIVGNADGAVERQAEATSTVFSYPLITGQPPATEIQAGLPIVATCQTVRLERQVGGETIQGVLGRFARLFARVYQTIGLMIDGQRISFRQPTDDMGRGVPPYTGDVMLDGNADYDRDKRILLTHDQPAPCIVLGLFGTLSIGEN